MSTQIEYYLGREQQERARAAACADPRIVAIHNVMADSYFARTSAESRLIRMIEQDSPANAHDEAERLGG